MTCGARPGLKPYCWPLIHKDVDGLNDLWSSSGIETNKITLVPNDEEIV